MKLPWLNGARQQVYPSLGKNITCDVCVIGGGITGVSSAYLLQRSGLKVVLLERYELGSGVSAYSTGHLSSLLDIHYHKAISRFSEEEARLLYGATLESRALIKSLDDSHGLGARLGELPAYYYASSQKQEEILALEAEALEKIGAPIERLKKSSFPLGKYSAIRLAKQGSFDVLGFIRGLAEAFTSMGGQVFEQSGVTDFENNGDFVDVLVGRRVVKAKYMLQATHTPLKINPLQLELRSYNSYVVVGESSQAPPQGLFYDLAKPYHYSRPFELGSKLMWMIGGADSKTGAHSREAVSLRKLEKFARSQFQLKDIQYHWGSLFFKSADGLPFIGADPVHRNCFLATGFGGDGLSYGVLSAIIINALLTAHGEHPLKQLFNPSRLKLKSIAGIAKQGVDTYRHLIQDRINLNGVDLNELNPGEGKVLHIKGEKLGIYINDEGEVFPVNPVCTHMKCLLEWNEVARSWDCGCHGSRFDIRGNVISGPATLGLFEAQALGKLKEE